jgi:gas vesicle protein
MQVPRFGKRKSIMKRMMSNPMFMGIGRSKSMRRRMIVPMLIGVGVGALVGFGAAILVAPRSGRMTRMRIAEKGNDIAYQAKQVTNKAKSRIQSSIRRPTRGVFERNNGDTPMELQRDVTILESDIDKTYDV